MSLIAVPIQVRDDTEFDDGAGGDTAGDGDGGDATSAAAASGLPWDDDPSRDYKYEELLGAASCLTSPANDLQTAI